jgi:glycosyltransferase involved in cell wall biosynthesis
VRIVLAVGTLRVGGTETQLVKLAAGLVARGHEVHVLALSSGGPLEEPLRAAGVGVRIFGFRAREIGQLLSIHRYLRSLRPDVCHTFLYTCNVFVLPLAKLAGVPLRVAGRRGAEPVLPGLRHQAVRAVGRRAAMLHVCNSAVRADEVVRLDGVPAARVLVIPNGVELPTDLAEPGREPARGIVVASLRAVKGHRDLLAALATMADPPRVCLVGDGPDRPAIAAEIGRLGLAGVVRLAGQRPDARAALRGYQFAILPSHNEGLPNAVLEAMAAGLPVVATAVGAVPDVVADGVTGFVVPPRQPAQLAAAIERLAGDPALRAQLGKAARVRAEDFSVASCVDTHEATYRQWLS